MKNAILYIRFSTKQQERGASRDRQLEYCQRFADERGWHVSEIIEDLGISAWKGDHLATGQLGRFAERVRNGEIPPNTVLICERLDRLSRQEPRKAQRWLEDLTELGVEIATVDGSRIYNNENLRSNMMNVFEILMVGKLANDYSNSISDRVGDRWRRKLENADAKIVTRKVAGWMRVEDDQIKLIPHHVKTLNYIYELAAEGLGVRAIAKRLNSEGVPTWSTKTETWDQSVIRHLLRTPTVEGDFISGGANPNRVKLAGIVINNYYPRAVPADLVEKARANMATRKQTGGRTRTQFANLFQSMIVCDRCQSTMYQRTRPRGERVYQCSNAMQNRGCTNKRFFDYVTFEKAVLDHLLARAMDDRYFRKNDEAAQLEVNAAELRKQISSLEARNANLARAIAETDGDPSIFALMKDNRAAISQATSELDKTTEALLVAKGQATPAEHIQRVRDVAQQIYDDDQAIKETARARVHQALKSIITDIACSADGDPTFTVTLLNGLAAVVFDNEGNVIHEYDRSDEADFVAGTNPDPSDLADYKRRMN